MVYKSKNDERNKKIVQFVGDCITQKVMSRRAAVMMAAETFHLSEPQIYYIIRRHIRVYNESENKEANNG